MKLEWKLSLGTGIFLLGTMVLYYVTSYEWAGTALLGFGGFAYLMLFGFLLLQWRRRHGLPRAEDRYDARYEDGAGQVSYFPNNSIWPVGLGLGFVFTAIGLVYGTWFFVIGGILLVGAIIGYSVEAEAK